MADETRNGSFPEVAYICCNLAIFLWVLLEFYYVIPFNLFCIVSVLLSIGVVGLVVFWVRGNPPFTIGKFALSFVASFFVMALFSFTVLKFIVVRENAEYISPDKKHSIILYNLLGVEISQLFCIAGPPFEQLKVARKVEHSGAGFGYGRVQWIDNNRFIAEDIGQPRSILCDVRKLNSLQDCKEIPSKAIPTRNGPKVIDMRKSKKELP